VQTLSMEMPCDETGVLVGPSGSAKNTTLKMIDRRTVDPSRWDN
jgi:ABC-type proline/glycine betaine transport system ATPase subunit